LDKHIYGKLDSDKIRFNRELSGSFNLWNPEMWIYEKLDPKIQKENDQYWLIIPYKLPSILPTNDNTMGVDLGLRVMATTSTGKGFKGNDYKHRRREIRYLKDILKSKADKGSRTAKKHLKKLSHKERNFTKNYIHLLSNALIKEAKENNKDVIILEDLSFDPKKSSRGSNRRRSQMPYFEIKQIITYKAHSSGCRVDTVNPAYTSQTNYLTGLVEGVRDGRMFKEPEGRILDADWNASLNISGSPFFLTKVIPISGKLQIEDRLLSTNHTIITKCIYQAPCL
jgi:IS605 OrfB family transposase